MSGCRLKYEDSHTSIAQIFHASERRSLNIPLQNFNGCRYVSCRYSKDYDSLAYVVLNNPSQKGIKRSVGHLTEREYSTETAITSCNVAIGCWCVNTDVTNMRYSTVNVSTHCTSSTSRALFVHTLVGCRTVTLSSVTPFNDRCATGSSSKLGVVLRMIQWRIDEANWNSR